MPPLVRESVDSVRVHSCQRKSETQLLLEWHMVARAAPLRVRYLRFSECFEYKP